MGSGVFEDLFDGGVAVVDVAETVFAEGEHAEFDGFLFDDDGWGAFADEVAERVAHVEEFVETAAAAVAGGVAVFAAATGVEVFVADFVGAEAELVEDGLAGLVGDAAGFADGAEETLSENGLEGSGDEEWFAAHVDETGDCAWGVVGVEGGEDEVTSEGGLDGDGGGFLVAHFADHDAVRVLPEEGAEDLGEGDADGFVDGDLDDAFDVVFDWVFAGEEFAVDGIDLAEGGVERGGFACAGGACDDEDAVGFLDGIEDVVVEGWREGEVFEVQIDAGAVEDPEHDGFPVDGGERADAHVDLFTADDFHDAAVLRDPAFGDIEVRHDLDPGRDDGPEVRWGRGHFDETAVDAVADFEIAFEGFEVDVGGFLFDGLEEDEVDVADDGGGVGFGFEAAWFAHVAELEA